MRTIKFRGKDIMDDHWVFGDLHVLCDRPHIHTYPSAYPYAGRRSFVDPATVGQFTGLFDKDGKEIYEGDIIKWLEIGHSDHDVLEPPEDYIREYMDVVEFLGGTFCVGREEAPSLIPVEFLTKEYQTNEDDMFKWVYNMDEYPNITIDDMYICEVIGNIHDNPELLEKGDNDE